MSPSDLASGAKLVTHQIGEENLRPSIFLVLRVRYQSDFTFCAVKEKLSTGAQTCEEHQFQHKKLWLKVFLQRGNQGLKEGSLKRVINSSPPT